MWMMLGREKWKGGGRQGGFGRSARVSCIQVELGVRDIDMIKRLERK